jgi:hypothetical protein
MNNGYDKKITAWKILKVFVYAAIPAGLGALINVPELAMYSPIIAGVLTGFENWVKHRND